MQSKRIVFALVVCLIFPVARGASAQGLFEEEGGGSITLPAGAKVLHDLPYGSDPKQRIDVYLPAQPMAQAPVIFMVHGGGWRWGDKTNSRVVQNKIDHWLPKGFIFISVNNRLLPEADPLKQADDVAAALAFAQREAPKWGGDPGKFILIGHSAGAHLVLLLAADPGAAESSGAKPWLGTVSLDSGAIDVPRIMNNRHFRLYDQAFGKDPDYWHRASPLYRLKAGAAPMLLVCSAQRQLSCPEADDMAAMAKLKGVTATVLKENLKHGQINEELGLPGAYTEAVDAFVGGIMGR